MSKDLSIRSLGDLRRVNPSTYIDLRLLLDSEASLHVKSSWLEESTARKTMCRKTPRYRKTKVFKSIDKEGVITHRDLHIPSPTTSLSESYVLLMLARNSVCENPGHVYSYHLNPKQDSWGNYHHYSGGYRLRNAAIGSALSLIDDGVAIITDLRRFYPSIDPEFAIASLQNKLKESSLSATQMEMVNNAVTNLCSQTTSGIPLGSSLSHLLANAAMTEVDKDLSSTFSGRYFRYVDDIAIVIPRSELASAEETLKSIVEENAGYELHAGKHDVLGASDWINNAPTSHRGSLSDPFSNLCFQIKVFLALNPDRIDSLKSTLEQEGINLPIERLGRAAKKSSFHGRIKLYWRRGWRLLKAFVKANEQNIVNDAKECGRIYRDKFKHLADSQLSPSPTISRFQCQRIRYCLNRMLYLLPPEDILNTCAEILELRDFYETRTLLRSLCGKSLNDLLEIPGLAVWSFGSFCKKPISETLKCTPTTVDAISTLIAYGLIEPDQVEFGIEGDKRSQYYLGCREKKSLEDLSYEHEVHSLRNGSPVDEPLNILNSHLFEEESIMFEALHLGGNYYS